MILIFNKAGLLFLLFGAIGAWVAAFVLWSLGRDEGGVPWTLISFCAITGGFDIASRYLDVFRTGADWLRVVRPSAGGQLFFIPVWVLTVALLVLFSVI
jgi:hypothetical protein